ncbi:MAG: hypothetical protein CM15mP117_00660 [Alphaproteobacteria bacterium]|nr:MAG: hypothetical protein CM15mP117_00660 [Alphaproteobacteria bacterium]
MGAYCYVHDLRCRAKLKQAFEQKLNFYGSGTPEKVLNDMANAGFNVTHLYGLTEVYGPAVINDWHTEWSDLTESKQAPLKARQGVRYHALRVSRCLIRIK